MKTLSNHRSLLCIFGMGAILLVLPLVLGYGWNLSSGPRITNGPSAPGQRFPAHPITIEPWGAAVVLEPAESRLHRYIAVGDAPLWNPYQGLGQPYAAQGDGSPYALTAVIRALAPRAASNAITIALFLLAAASVFWIVRMFGLAVGPSGFAAVATFISTSHTFHIPRYNIADQYVFISLLSAAAAWAASRPSPLSFFLVVAISAMSMVAGFIPTAPMGLGAALFIGALIVSQQPLQQIEKIARTVALLGFACIGIAITAPYLLSILELAANGFHKNLSAHSNVRLPVYNVFAFFAPALFGPPAGNSSLGDGTWPVDWPNLFATANTTTLIICSIGLFACDWRQTQHRRAFLLLVAASAILFLRYLDLAPFFLLDALPLIGKQSLKHSNVLSAFFLVIAAAFVLQSRADWDIRRAQRVIGSIAMILIATFLCAVFEAPLTFPDREAQLDAAAWAGLALPILICAAAWLLVRAPAEPQRSALLFAGVVVAELSYYIPLGTDDPVVPFVRLGITASIASIVAMTVVSRLFLRRILTAGLVFVFITAYAWIILFPKNGLPQLEVTRTIPNFADFLRKDAGQLYRSFGIFPDFSSQVQVRDLGVVGPFATSDFAALIRVIDVHGISSFFRSSEFMLAGRRYFPLDAYLRSKPVLDWMGVRYLVLDKQFLRSGLAEYGRLSRIAPEFRRVYDDDDVTIVESTASKPRVEFTSDYAVYRSRFEILRQLQASPATILGQALVESVDAQKLPPRSDNSVSADIQILRDRPNEMAIKIRTSKPGLLVIKDSHYVGWRAEVDGTTTDVLRVNGMVRGIPIYGAGEHQVRVWFAPPSYSRGKAITIVSCVLALAGLMIVFRSRKMLAFYSVGVFGLLSVMTVLEASRHLETASPLRYIQLRKERLSAYDLHGYELKQRVAFPTNAEEMLVFGRIARLPVLFAKPNDRFPLRIGDLLFDERKGLAEIDDTGALIPVVVPVGQDIQLVRPSITDLKQLVGSATYGPHHQWSATRLKSLSKE
jgi:hypothetical protein